MTQTDRLFATLVADHHAALVSYVRTIVRDHHLAEDIVQETLIRAWLRTERLHSTEGSLRGWLLTVARNLAIDWLRSAAARHECVGVAEEPVAVVPDHADRVVARTDAAATLRRLSAEHRSVVAHMSLAGWTAQETASHLDIPVGTVKSRQHYALSQLRARELTPAY
ncbi:sigma-70 family RNA polymerase sigma factor [Actinoplanes sp. TRM 88003]|uniref:Sigma-70 family RNA polymerase sigma factor n=1 Tax=Paractinoplanes aksuensis TaxID=2939490 RepID=A0ABT1DWH8_9ACTN|nr:sigma-70 family RNA polymerase sigma factor [Actinoplanes aksuensis]MCO8275214.1 sigma-70 family RNA polymerase sigma factor [Actinoplanes aksuensis]